MEDLSDKKRVPSISIYFTRSSFAYVSEEIILSSSKLTYHHILRSHKKGSISKTTSEVAFIQNPKSMVHVNKRRSTPLNRRGQEMSQTNWIRVANLSSSCTRGHKTIHPKLFAPQCAILTLLRSNVLT